MSKRELPKEPKRVKAQKPESEFSHKIREFSKQLTPLQRYLMLAIAVVAIVLVCTLAYQAVFAKPDLPAVNTDPDVSHEDTLPEEILETGVQPKVSGERKSDDYYTFLVLGRDTGGGGNTDTMMVVSYDITNQDVTVMSIPRDTMVNVPWDVKKINSVYNWYGGEDKGIQALNNEISELIGFVPDYQVVIEWEAVEDLVNAIDGVWFDVPYDMNYTDPYQDLVIDVDKGYQLLDGDKAMQVIRWRYNDDGSGYSDGDLGRIATQQAFLTAVAKQLLSIENVAKISELSQVFFDNVETELTISNLLWFGKSAVFGGLTMEHINFVTMPNTPITAWSRTYENYQSYVQVNASEMLDLVNDSLSPYVQEVTLNELDIMYKNSDGSLSSTTGYVSDTIAASPPVIPTDDEEEEDTTGDGDGDGDDIDTNTDTNTDNSAGDDDMDVTTPDVDEPTADEPTVDDDTTVGDGVLDVPTPEEPTGEEPTVEEPTVEEPSADTTTADSSGMAGALSQEEIDALLGA
ncbi:LCP family protein [Bengtsoniella intestinalis]|uniref:LCP family protein n=1 Tax=Bengtsoniella intestinalis TaxID=3073143 RepID=UPI00391F0242